MLELGSKKADKKVEGMLAGALAWKKAGTAKLSKEKDHENPE